MVSKSFTNINKTKLKPLQTKKTTAIVKGNPGPDLGQT
jgi:hypothetical protein